jgi:hypothetical protein
MVCHVALVFLTFAVPRHLRAAPAERVGEVKERWPVAVPRAGEGPPHRATPIN